MSDINLKDVFGFNINDRLYIANIEKGKVFDFMPDCIKVFKNNITVHGYIYGLYGKWGTPTEYSIKWLNKRCIFTKKQDAKKWLENKEKALADMGV